MSKWLANTLQKAEHLDDWLLPKRQASLKLLNGSQWPTRKTEAWKYTSLSALENADFPLASNEADSPSVDGIVPIPGLDAIELHFINGKLQGIPDDLPEGLIITSLSDNNEVKWAKEEFANIKPERHLFGLVNDVLAQSGLLIDVADHVVIEKPLRIVEQISESCETHTRIVVRIGKGARLSIIEQFSGSVESFNTGFAEYSLDDEARLEHYRFALQQDEAMAVGGSHFRLGNNAILNSTLVGFGSKLSRLDVDVEHAGEFAKAVMNAIYLLDGNELFDLHSTIEHAQPNGTTLENVRGIVSGHAHAVFNGRIHIHRHAQKTLAELNNANLLLSRDAEIDTKPELEIYADDVRCAHGATVAEVDKTALYYLQSRGIGLSEARVMLSIAFINQLIELIPDAALATWLQSQLRTRFDAMNEKG